jgi:hypothetical protein
MRQVQVIKTGWFRKTKAITFLCKQWRSVEFNGSSWELYPSPNETMRSVKVIGDKVYGGYMEFGYWTRQSNGNLNIHH